MATPEPIDNAPQHEAAVSSPATKPNLAHNPWFLALVLVVAVFLAYQPAWRAGFIWDDDVHLTANPALTAPHGLRMIWSSLAVSRYYPLTITTFWVQRRLWGLNPMPYHVFNIALQALNGILLFLVLRRLRIRPAWLAATLWALHPVNVESVAWITEMKNTQSGVFFFLTVLCFLRFEAQPRRGWYVLALLCGLAAMLSKPSTVILPLALLLCVWWNRGHWQRADMARSIPFFGLALAMSVLTVIEQRGHVLRAGTGEWQSGIGERLVIAGKDIWFYAAKVLWPARLTFVYPRWEAHTAWFSSWVPLAGLVGVGLILWRYRNRSGPRAALFGCGFFVVALLPVLGFFEIYYFRYSFVADHFQYLASVGLVALAAGAGTALCDRAAPWGKHIGAATAAVILIVLGTLTWNQAHIYRDALTVWQDTIAKNPRCLMAHNNLGVDLARLGRDQEAIRYYEQVLQLKPDYPEAEYNLGLALARLGRQSEAIEHFRLALRIRPLAEAEYNLGLALAQLDRESEAIEHYRLALQINPNLAEAHDDLGLALAKLGQLPEAIEHWELALQIKPDYAEAQYNLGLALAQLGRQPEAIAHWELALRIKPDYAEAEYNLGLALAQLGREPEAIEHWKQALRINPDLADAHYNLGFALEKSGRASEAVEHYQQALKLRPDFTAAINALARLKARP
jgi:tetratricopeptide (TPR) repeat protein